MEVFARTDEAEPRVGGFLVPAEAPGVTIVETWDHLGLRASAAYSLHGTCLSFLLALHHAALLLHAGQARHVLIVSSEAGSLGLNFAQPESTLLIGDGAAAVLVGRAEGEEGVQAMRFETYPEGADHTRIRGGGSLLPPGHPGADPLDFTFDMQGRRVLRLAAQVVPDFLERLRPGLSSGLPGIDRVVPHQASAAGLDLMRRMGWPPEQTETTLATLGNVVAASLPLTLHRALAGTGGRPQTLLLVGTGAGLSVGGLILRT